MTRVAVSLLRYLKICKMIFLHLHFLLVFGLEGEKVFWLKYIVENWMTLSIVSHGHRASPRSYNATERRSTSTRRVEGGGGLIKPNTSYQRGVSFCGASVLATCTSIVLFSYVGNKWNQAICYLIFIKFNLRVQCKITLWSYTIRDDKKSTLNF